MLPPIAAHSADEAVRMPECPECGDVVIQNGALAALATRGEQLQEVPAAVGAALALMETWDRNRGDRKKPMCSRSGVLHHLRPEARGWAGRGWWCTTERGLEGTGPVGLSVRGGEQKGPGKFPKRSWLGQRARLGISKVHGLLMQKPSSYPHLRKVPHN